MYFWKLLKEIRIWYIIYKEGKKHEKFLNDNNIRRDWFGRLYSVINLPEEIANHPYAREPYVLEKLRDYDQILIQVKLTDLVVPEFSPIPNTDAYLLIMSGVDDYINIWRFLWNSAIYYVCYWILKLIYHYMYNKGIIDIILDFVKKNL